MSSLFFCKFLRYFAIPPKSGTMRKLFLPVMFLCLFVTVTHAQMKNDTNKATPPVKDSLAPYQKYPTLPAFNILMMDSVTVFNTYNILEGKPIAIFFFSP